MDLEQGLIEVQRRSREVFENEVAAESWLNSPTVALGGKSPRKVIMDQGSAGVELVLNELGRIEHGIVS